MKVNTLPTENTQTYPWSAMNDLISRWKFDYSNLKWVLTQSFSKNWFKKLLIPVYLGTFKDLSGMHSLYGDDLCRQPNFLILYDNK